MKTKISPYIKYLFVQNAVYIFFAAVLLISLFIIPPVMFSTYTKNSENIDQLQKDILDLKSKKNTLAFISGSDLKNIDNYYDLVSALIPESENYFSIIYTLSNLSELTNFNISSYSINLQGSTNNKISIQVRGEGNQSEFLDFLKQYNFGGGRLITAERILLNSEEFSGITLSLNFYNKKTSLSKQQSTDYQKVLAKIDQIKDKISFNIQTQSASDGTGEEEYPTKTNPF
ncbi:hypothetical protein A3F29_03180 [Candidatus Roizmanbacteria bacterium RIFCSPHIGHO2_12_FULL_33_9]|uniref:Uncharacterized protein n=1 Tax=Candidatus Roizmanbacteria bacterium RIFCSPHIGHO2_12_FULL_33_9 TaxID=1802045 RepID=A0A1F7HII3_9BACT|nr:MAG: hypothetical protein A3F29_03180 [Candidatus Roizmanbacteria bacterium RIFCSPHIGHO2_12_FULL_33_9]